MERRRKRPCAGHRLAWKKFGILLAATGLAASSGCRDPDVSDRLASYRTGVEEVLGLEASPPYRVVLSLPERRARILPVPEHTIGPFDFLATIGCRLSEVIASRNGSLGRVLEPTRRLAYEVDVIRAGEACLPSLSEARAGRLETILNEKKHALARHAWNAVWLDAELERFLSSGPSHLIGGIDATDGPRQLRAAAAAVRASDVDALEDAFEQLRDDSPAGPRLREVARAANDLRRTVEAIGALSVSTCGARERGLVRTFEERFVPARGELAELDRDGLALSGAVEELFRALDAVEPSESMRDYREAVAGGGGRSGAAARLRSAIVDHARAMGGVLEVCGEMPGRA